MRLLHTSDLHLGKRLGGYSLLEDQAYILEQILQLAQSHRADALLLAGDIYDKLTPSADAVCLLDDFLTRVSSLGIACFAIAGNHDSAERLAYCGQLLQKSGVYVSRVYDGTLQTYTLQDIYGPVEVTLLPFLRPVHVRPFFPDGAIATCQDAVQTALSAVEREPGVRRVLLSHQFVTAGGGEPIRSDSETIFVGGTDNVDSRSYDGFDYVALGHIHAPQWVGRETVRYAGSPLKYSFSEARQEKSVTLVELGEQGSVTVTPLPLKPLRDLRQVRGPIDRLLDPAVYAQAGTEDYMGVILTDPAACDALARVRTVYPYLVSLSFDTWNGSQSNDSLTPAVPGAETPLELFTTFYQAQNDEPPTDEMSRLIANLLDKEADT